MEYTNQDVRRQDRLLDEVRAFEILKEGEFGILSMRTEEGDGAYGIPINYVWDRGNSIYIHCAPVGRKLRCIDACPNVSFCVTGRSKVIPKVIPDKFTTGYESIVLQCTAHHSLHEAERMSALSLLISKYCPEHKMRGIEYANKSFHRTEIIRLDIQKVSGKCKNMANKSFHRTEIIRLDIQKVSGKCKNMGF